MPFGGDGTDVESELTLEVDKTFIPKTMVTLAVDSLRVNISKKKLHNYYIEEECGIEAPPLPKMDAYTKTQAHHENLIVA